MPYGLVERRCDAVPAPGERWTILDRIIGASAKADRNLEGTYPGRRLALVALPLAIAMAVSPPARGETSPSAEVADRAAIETLFTEWEAAWARHDMKAFADLYHQDCVFIAWTGAKWLGRDAVEKGHADVHKTVFRNSVQRKRIDGIQFLAPDAALVHLWSTLTGDERQPDKVVRSRNTLVLTKRAGEWKILSFQNTRLADNVPD